MSKKLVKTAMAASSSLSPNISLTNITKPLQPTAKPLADKVEEIQPEGAPGTISLHASHSAPRYPNHVERKRENVIQLRNVSKTYLIGEHAVAALRGLSLSVSRGEFVLIYGKSGSGKSSLLSIMGTVDFATKGDVYVLGERVNQRTKDGILSDLRLTKIGFVFQSFNLLSLSTARENVMLPMALAGRLTRRERHRRADYLLERVGMEHRMDNRPSQLSGGEQQRVTIARALSNQPTLLLMDEPTGDLDEVNTDNVMELLVDLHEEERTIVMVTHDRNLRGLADRIVYVCDGLVSHEEVVPYEVRRARRAGLRERNARRR